CFLQKLWRMLESRQFQSVWWSQRRKYVAIKKELFKKEVLDRKGPLQVFPVWTWKSFVQQLNTHGFTKIHQDFPGSASLPECLAEAAPAYTQRQILYYYNPSFTRQHPYLLGRCKRR
ncbi:HSFY1 protein, partial [Urocolius indicus]|nr:HSFY1 protein [Urocolius indicus]